MSYEISTSFDLWFTLWPYDLLTRQLKVYCLWISDPATHGASHQMSMLNVTRMLFSENIGTVYLALENYIFNSNYSMEVWKV